MRNPVIFLSTLFNGLAKRPFFISHLITGKCNARCPTCRWRSEKSDGSLTEILNFYKQAKIEGFYSTTLWGGEPLMRDDIFEIVRSIKEMGFKIGLITNGNYLNEKIEITKHLDFLIISMDAVGEKLDTLRGITGLYERISDAVNKIKNKRLMINTVVSNFSYPDCLKVADFAKKYNCIIFYEYPIGKGLLEKKISFAAFMQILKLKDRGYPIGNSRQYLISAAREDFEYKCRVRDFSITVFNDGSIRNCITGEFIGNTYFEDLRLILMRKEFQNLRKISHQCNRCTDSGAYESSRTIRLKFDAVFNSLRLFWGKT